MSNQFLETTVGIMPEVETVTTQWVVAEEYEKLQSRIKELEVKLANEKARTTVHEHLLEAAHYSRLIGLAGGQCTPSRTSLTDRFWKFVHG